MIEDVGGNLSKQLAKRLAGAGCVRERARDPGLGQAGNGGADPPTLFCPCASKRAQVVVEDGAQRVDIALLVDLSDLPAGLLRAMYAGVPWTTPSSVRRGS